MQDTTAAVQSGDSLLTNLTSMNVRIDSLSDVTDSLLGGVFGVGDTMSMRITDMPHDWSLFVDGFLSLLLIGVTALLGARTHGLGQAQIALEKARDEDRNAIVEARRSALDQRIGALAYLVVRQLRSWLAEPMEGGPADQSAERLLAKTDRIDLGPILQRWARQRSAEAGSVEERLVEIAARAPDASVEVRKSAYDGFVQFYEAMSRINRLPGHGTTGYGVEAANLLHNCISSLEVCVPSELRRPFVPLPVP